MMQLEAIAFNFKPIVKHTISELAPMAKDKSLEIELIEDGTCHDGWIGDSIRIKQIMLNLCSNAIKFTKQGKVSIHILNNQDGLHFSIKDTGIGLGEEQISRVFSRFEQADTSTTRNYGGTGLGMAIIKALVELMSGTIKLESELGKGSYFEIFLPLKPIDFQQTQVTKDNNNEIPDLSGKTILVAEDNGINQVIIQTMLEATRATIYIAANGQEAISLNQQHQVDLILMDIQMPIMNGIDAFKLIQKETPTVPVIALTANVMKSDVDNYLTLGFKSYIAKPIDMQLLYQNIAIARG